MVAPLQKYLHNYTKHLARHPIQIDEEGQHAFATIKSLIECCPKLFFLDDNSPIYLNTDASSYGVGGNIYQLTNDHEVPIAFMSSSLTGSQLNWENPQKEAYAIYAAIYKFEYLLRDKRFTIRTDHRNITFMNNSDLSSIRKWKIFISEFDYQLEYIDGETNIVADALSRLTGNFTSTNNNDTPVMLAAFPERIHIPSETHRLIARVHNTSAGHHGVDRTIHKLLQLLLLIHKEPWPLLRSHVKQFISLCPCCQKMSVLKTPIIAHPFTVSAYEPMQRLNIDFIGPFPDGQYILNIIDCFSRWIELYLYEQANATMTARKLLEHIGCFGAPTQIISDRGSHFVNDVINELLALIGTEHCLNIAYSKEESALVESE